MTINRSFIGRVCVVLCALFVVSTSVFAKESKAVANEKVRRQSLHKAWLDKKLTNEAYYTAVDAPTIAGCHRSIARAEKVMKLYRSKLKKAQTVRAKKKYIGALKSYKVYVETLAEVLKAFKANESGRVSTDLFPILRKSEKRIALYTGRSVKRDYFFTPEIYPQYFKSKGEDEPVVEKKSDKTKSGQSEVKK